MGKGPKFAHIWICWPSWWGLSFLCQTLDEKKSYEVQLCKQCTMDWKPLWISAAEPNSILNFRTDGIFLVELGVQLCLQGTKLDPIGSELPSTCKYIGCRNCSHTSCLIYHSGFTVQISAIQSSWPYRPSDPASLTTITRVHIFCVEFREFPI